MKTSYFLTVDYLSEDFQLNEGIIQSAKSRLNQFNEKRNFKTEEKIHKLEETIKKNEYRLQHYKEIGNINAYKKEKRALAVNKARLFRLKKINPHIHADVERISTNSKYKKEQEIMNKLHQDSEDNY